MTDLETIEKRIARLETQMSNIHTIVLKTKRIIEDWVIQE